MALRAWVLGGSLVVAGAGCDSGETGDSQTSATDSATDSSTTTGTEGSGTAVADESGTASAGTAPLSLEECMAQTGISLDCGEGSRFQYVVFGDVLGCGGTASFTQEELVRFTYSIGEIVDGVIQIQSLRVITTPVDPENRFEALAPAPVPLPDLPLSIAGWTGDLHALPPGIFDLEGGQATVVLDAIPTQEQLDTGTAMVSGTFEVMGGAVTNIGAAVDDPGVHAYGCFAAPAESHAVELD